MTEKKYYIYLIVNLINGKTYIGKHLHIESEDPELFDYSGSGKVLQRAYKKYGIYSFQKIILQWCSENEVDELEKKFIQIFKGFNRCEYNIAESGNGGYTMKYATDLQKQQQSKKIKEKLLNKPKSENHKKHIRESLTGRKLTQEHKQHITDKLNEIKPFLGKKHSKNSIEKMKQAKLGKNNPQYGKSLNSNQLKFTRIGTLSRQRKVICLETKEVFNSIKEASIKFNLNVAYAIRCNKEYKGYHFNYL